MFHILDLAFLGLESSIAAFVIEGPGGLVLVECGPASTLPAFQSAIARHGWKMQDFRQVFLSHIHFDHAGAAWAFAENGAKVYVHPKGLPHLAAPEKLYNSARMIYGEDMDRLWGEMRSIPETLLYAPEHGEVIEAAGLRFTAWYTPGHAVHHIAWQCNDEMIFTGDVAGVRIGKGPVMPPCPPPDINIEHWLESLDLLENLPVERLVLTHFGEVENKSAHLAALRERLQGWASWMQPYAEKNAAPESLVPVFQQFVQKQLLDAGVSEAELARYEAANPAFMSVAGLLRYWKKKMQAAGPQPT